MQGCEGGEAAITNRKYAITDRFTALQLIGSSQEKIEHLPPCSCRHSTTTMCFRRRVSSYDNIDSMIIIEWCATSAERSFSKSSGINQHNMRRRPRRHARYSTPTRFESRSMTKARSSMRSPKHSITLPTNSTIPVRIFACSLSRTKPCFRERASKHTRAGDGARHISIVVRWRRQSISSPSTHAMAVSLGERQFVAPTPRPPHNEQQHGYFSNSSLSAY